MENTNPCYGERLDQALALVADAFRFERRKGSGIPYLTHLMQVAVTVGEYGGDENQMIAALLHDYLEDIPGATAEDLRERFGDDVTEIVVSLTDSNTHPKPPWKERKVAYLNHLTMCPARTRLVCAADKLHNAQSMIRDHAAVGPVLWERFTASREECLWYYQSLCDKLSDGWADPLLDELHNAVRALHSLD